MLSAYSTPEDFLVHCDQLALRLESKSMLNAATLCYMLSINVEKTCDMWNRTVSSDAAFVQMASVFQMTLAQPNRLIETPSAMRRFGSYAAHLAEQGQFEAAVKYASMASYVDPQAAELCERIFKSHAHLFSYTPGFPFQRREVGFPPAVVEAVPAQPQATLHQQANIQGNIQQQASNQGQQPIQQQVGPPTIHNQYQPQQQPPVQSYVPPNTTNFSSTPSNYPSNTYSTSTYPSSIPYQQPPPPTTTSYQHTGFQSNNTTTSQSYTNNTPSYTAPPPPTPSYTAPPPPTPSYTAPPPPTPSYTAPPPPTPTYNTNPPSYNNSFNPPSTNTSQGYTQPVPSQLQPTPSQPQPTPSQPQPTPSQPQPTPSYSVEPTSSYTAEQSSNSYTGPTPSYTAAAPPSTSSYTAPPPSYTAPPPSYTPQENSFRLPLNTFNAPEEAAQSAPIETPQYIPQAAPPPPDAPMIKENDGFGSTAGNKEAGAKYGNFPTNPTPQHGVPNYKQQHQHVADQPAVVEEPVFVEVSAEMDQTLKTMTMLIEQIKQAQPPPSKAELRQLQEAESARSVLETKLQTNLVSASVQTRLRELTQAFNAYDFKTASSINVQLTTTDWSEHKDWLKGTKYLIVVASRRFSQQ